MPDPRLIGSRDAAPIAAATVAVIGLDTILVAMRGLPLDVASIGGPAALSAGLQILSFLYRRRSAEIAAAAGFAGWFVLFTAAMAILNALLLPIRFPSIDPLLLRADAALGWSWPSMVAFGAAHPVVSQVLRTVYESSLMQVAALVCALALSGRRSELRHLSGTLTLSAGATVGFWFFFPSFGPSAFAAVDPALVRGAGLAVDPAYGAELLRLAHEGPLVVSLDHAKGLIAFPSFHTVMAAICVWHARDVAWLRVVVWPLNALMVPAILLHGGHHLVDVPAGLLVFALSLWIVRGTSRRRSVSRPVVAGG